MKKIFWGVWFVVLILFVGEQYISNNFESNYKIFKHVLTDCLLYISGNENYKNFFWISLDNGYDINAQKSKIIICTFYNKYIKTIKSKIKYIYINHKMPL